MLILLRRAFAAALLLAARGAFPFDELVVDPATLAAYTLSTEGSDYDTVLSIHNGCPANSGTAIGCNDDVVIGNHSSYIHLNLTANQTYCFSRNADASVYQVRAEGTATKNGARFRFLRNGVVLEASPTDTAKTFYAERRGAYYPGPGTYTICAANHYATNTLVNLHILFNNEFI